MIKALLILVLLCNTGCIAAFVGSSAASGVVAIQDKTIGNAIDDTSITAKIHSDFIQKNFDHLFATVNVETHEARVLLTGRVKDPDLMAQAVQICWETKGVKEVINEIVVDDNTGKLSIGDITLDSLITTKIKTKLIAEKKVKSVNYNIETIEQVVYVIGIARTQEEADIVINIINSVDSVKRVANYMKIMDNNTGTSNTSYNSDD